MFFPYRFEKLYRGLWWLAGAREGIDGVTLTKSTFIATFGRKRVETPLSNISHVHVTMDYRWWKAVGVRLSFVDDGLTFGTTTHGGVCIHFKERVPSVIGRKDHSALTVTVDNLAGLVSFIEEDTSL